MKLIIAGSRDLDGISYVSDALLDSPWSMEKLSEVVHGGADGIDSSAEEWANLFNVSTTVFEPDWDKHGKAAGPIRNAEMAEYGDALVAVWDGESRGTRSMIEKALDEGIEVYVKVVDDD